MSEHFFERLFLHFDATDQQKLSSAIEQLRHSRTISDESLLIILLKKLLEQLLRNTEKEISFDHLSKEQQEKLLKQLEVIAYQLSLTKDASLSSSEIYQVLLRVLFRSFSKQHQKEKEEKESRFEEFSEKEKERLEKEAERMLTYELYKIVNPNQVAGETRQQNFENNVRTRGLEEAKKYAGGKPEDLEKYSDKFVNRLQKEHQQIKKNGGIGMDF